MSDPKSSEWVPAEEKTSNGADNWEEVADGSFFTPENKGEFVIGAMLGIEPSAKFKGSTNAKIRQDDGKIVLVSNKVAVEKLETLIGSRVKLVYEGEVKSESSGMKYKDFTVYKSKSV